jgi:GT2 family glycosyltransferase
VTGLPEVSVIVPHLNQPAALAACLAALAAQDLAPDRFEVIVVDNGSAVLPEAITAAAGVRLAVEPCPGPGPARNRGAALARGEILAFTDADCRPDPGWLSALLAAFAAAPAVAVLGGRVEVVAADPRRPTAAEAFDIVHGMRQDELIPGQGFAATANLAVRARAFATVGPFVGIALAEDMDWCRRAAALGWPVAYAPDAVVQHPARASFAALARQWDRHVGHAWAALPPGPGARLGWLLRAGAVAASPLAGIRPLLATPRLHGGRQRLAAFGMLARLRLYRAGRMLRALAGPEARRGSLRWNR